MRTFFAVITLFVVGCHDTPTIPAMTEMVGTWSLRSLNGASLPVAVGDTEIVSSTLVATAGSFSITRMIRAPAGAAGTARAVVQ